MEFSEAQITRYARHILLKEVGGDGQARLLRSKVLVVGAGGLGSPVMLYLAAAGVGTIGVIDDDTVDFSNLQRQIIHTTASVGRPKVESAGETIAAINPEVKFIAHHQRITPENAVDIISGYDLVADGSDNFPTRFMVNDACYFAGKTLVSAAILRFDGQLSTFKASVADKALAEGEGSDGHGPCYRCLFSRPPPPGQIPTCAEAGVLGALCGTLGSMQATEVLKELLGIGESMSGSLIIYDALTTGFRKIKIKADPGCPLCGDAPTIMDMSMSEHER